MRSYFPLFQSHLDFCKMYWQHMLQSPSCVIDATCGNGYDTLFLAKHLKNHPGSTLHAIDIQPQAIQKTKQRIQEEIGTSSFIHYHKQSHAQFPSSILKGSVNLIVYNLGYLPGSCKTVITERSSTLSSIECALQLLHPGGVISITCYPGHPEGDLEELALAEWAQALLPSAWSVSLHRWCNRKKAPSVLFIQKPLSNE